MVTRVRVVRFKKLGGRRGHSSDGCDLAELDGTLVEFSTVGGLAAEAAELSNLFLS